MEKSNIFDNYQKIRENQAWYFYSFYHIITALSYVWKMFRYIVTFIRRDFRFCECRIVEGISSSKAARVTKETQWESPHKQRDRMTNWSIVVVSSVANVVVSCLLCRQQEHAGLNPTESMTRALISDDNIARQSALGPVQLGYVLPLIVTPSIFPVIPGPRNPKSWNESRNRDNWFCE